MPRKKITISEKVEYLSIWMEGESWQKARAGHPQRRSSAWHRAMLLGRKFDECLLNLQGRSSAPFRP